MIERIISKVATQVSQRSGDSRLPGDLKIEDLEARFDELDQQKTDQRDALRYLTDRYQTVVQMAARNDECLPWVRAELRRLFLRYAAKRLEYRITFTHWFFIRSWLTPSGRASPRLGTNLDDLQVNSPQETILSSGSLRLHGPVSDDDFSPRDHLEIERLVKTVVTAARSEESVPDIREVVMEEMDDALGDAVCYVPRSNVCTHDTAPSE